MYFYTSYSLSPRTIVPPLNPWALNAPSDAPNCDEKTFGEKNFRKFQNAKLEFAAHWQLFMELLIDCIVCVCLNHSVLSNSLQPHGL